MAVRTQMECAVWSPKATEANWRAGHFIERNHVIPLTLYRDVLQFHQNALYILVHDHLITRIVLNQLPMRAEQLITTQERLRCMICHGNLLITGYVEGLVQTWQWKPECKLV